MARGLSLYPASPADVPETLTQPTGQYRMRVFVVLASVVFFFLLYLGLLVGSAYLVYWGLTTPMIGEPVLGQPGRYHGVHGLPLILVRIVIPITAGLLFLFLLKGLFKRQPALKSYDIEITEQGHPRLWDFIEKLCDETGAPPPARVFVNFEANACVCYDGSILNLFRPAKKHLKIGLGLINLHQPDGVQSAARPRVRPHGATQHEAGHLRLHIEPAHGRPCLGPGFLR